MRLLLLVLCVSLWLVIAGGCKTQSKTMLGQPFAAGSVTSVQALRPSPTPVIIQGTMIEKCPISGCWFKLQDHSGIVKVDTKNAGFVAADVPTGAEVTVSGTYRVAPEQQFEATGMRY